MKTNIQTLDAATLEFARHLAWQFEFTCKKTKEGRTLAHAYSKMQSVLTHYIQAVAESSDNVNLCGLMDEEQEATA